MFTAKITSYMLAVALLSMTAYLTASSAAPVGKPEASNTSGITLVRQDRGGGRNFSSGGGNRGFSSRSFSERYADRGNGPRMRGFGVPREGVTISPRYERRHHHRKHRHHRFPGIIYGAGPYIDDEWYAGDDCDDLFEKAMATDSRYWWNLYYDCRDGD